MSDKKNQIPKSPKSAPENYEGLLENYRNAWQALRMIREAVETLGPPGALVSEDGVLRTYGPEPLHEGQAIVDALAKILNEPASRPEIAFNLGYLVAEIDELKRIAERSGYGTLAYLLEVAAIEAGHQARLQGEERERDPGSP